MTPSFDCADDEIAMKSFFLGPNAENADWLKNSFSGLIQGWFDARRRVSARDGSVIPPSDQRNPAFLRRRADLERLTTLLMERFDRELPKYSPRYMGHMFSELSMPALLGHVVALLQNPNNISKESSAVGLEIEREAVRMLLEMFGFDKTLGTGHFTSGGTIANFEAVVRARARQRRWLALGAYLREKRGTGPSFFEAAHLGRQAFDGTLIDEAERREFPAWSDELISSERFIERLESAYGEKWSAPALLVSAGTHYSWAKAADFFGVPREAFVEIPLDPAGRLDVASLKVTLADLERVRRPVMMLVTLAGSTELGTVDPIGAVQSELATGPAWARAIWHHVDAAYGGFFAALSDSNPRPLSSSVAADIAAIRHATSVTIDPHKLGYVPYASGVFLCAHRSDDRHHRVEAPYIDFDEDGDPGLQTIEGSRAATGAAATWLTGHAIGFNDEGYGRILRRTVGAKQALEDELRGAFGRAIFIPSGLDLNITCYAPFTPHRKVSHMNRAALTLFKKSGTAALDGYSLSKTVIELEGPRRFLREHLAAQGIEIDQPRLVLLRSCLMNPFLTSRHADVNFLAGFAMALKRAFDSDLVAGGI